MSTNRSGRARKAAAHPCALDRRAATAVVILGSREDTNGRVTRARKLTAWIERPCSMAVPHAR
jgi:hypothetical protein